MQSGNRASACSSYSRRVAHLNLISSVSFEISPSIKAQQTEVGGATRRAPLGRAAPGPPEPQGSPRLSEREMEKNRAVHALWFPGPEISTRAAVKGAVSCSSSKALHPAQLACLGMLGCGLYSYIHPFFSHRHIPIYYIWELCCV